MPNENPLKNQVDILNILAALMAPSSGRSGSPAPPPMPPSPLGSINRNAFAQAAAQRFAGQGPPPQGGSQPGFEYTMDLPMQKLLGRFPNNQLMNIIRALNPSASVYTNQQNPWDKPDEWGALFSLGRTW